uniref:Uncharacterized protein n=1 Tax=Moniliophthora roreri TaxID=221103 RepID=A0A0W0FKB7_MONRR
MDGAGPTNSYPPNRVEESHLNKIGNVDDFPQAGLSNGQPITAPSTKYGRDMFDSPYATSYGPMSSPEARSHYCMNLVTESSFPNLRLDPNHRSFKTATYSRKSPPATHNAIGSLHIAAGTGWSIPDLDCRCDGTYPLSITNDSTESVPALPNVRPRVIKQVVATEGVVDASYVHREP